MVQLPPTCNSIRLRMSLFALSGTESRIRQTNTIAQNVSCITTSCDAILVQPIHFPVVAMFHAMSSCPQRLPGADKKRQFVRPGGLFIFRHLCRTLHQAPANTFNTFVNSLPVNRKRNNSFFSLSFQRCLVMQINTTSTGNLFVNSAFLTEAIVRVCCVWKHLRCNGPL